MRGRHVLLFFVVAFSRDEGGWGEFHSFIQLLFYFGRGGGRCRFLSFSPFFSLFLPWGDAIHAIITYLEDWGLLLLRRTVDGGG